jgi:hypothetical protein
VCATLQPPLQAIQTMIPTQPFNRLGFISIRLKGNAKSGQNRLALHRPIAKGRHAHPSHQTIAGRSTGENIRRKN